MGKEVQQTRRSARKIQKAKPKEDVIQAAPRRYPLPVYGKPGYKEAKRLIKDSNLDEVKRTVKQIEKDRAKARTYRSSRYNKELGVTEISANRTPKIFYLAIINDDYRKLRQNRSLNCEQLDLEESLQGTKGIVDDLNISEDASFICYNDSAESIRNQINSFIQIVRQFDGQKLFLISFCGHGGVSNGQNVYFTNESDLQNAYICLQWIQQLSLSCPGIAILDICTGWTPRQVVCNTIQSDQTKGQLIKILVRTSQQFGTQRFRNMVNSITKEDTDYSSKGSMLFPDDILNIKRGVFPDSEISVVGTITDKVVIDAKREDSVITDKVMIDVKREEEDSVKSEDNNSVNEPNKSDANIVKELDSNHEDVLNDNDTFDNNLPPNDDENDCQPMQDDVIHQEEKPVLDDDDQEDIMNYENKQDYAFNEDLSVGYDELSPLQCQNDMREKISMFDRCSENYVIDQEEEQATAEMQRKLFGSIINMMLEYLHEFNRWLY